MPGHPYNVQKYTSIIYKSLHIYSHTHTHTHTYTQGIACNLDSPAFKKLDEATKEVIGESKPYSICGSLPLVGDLQEAGFDVQVGW